jgi:uncharacterized protein (TIGR03000 family)
MFRNTLSSAAAVLLVGGVIVCAAGPLRAQQGPFGHSFHASFGYTPGWRGSAFNPGGYTPPWRGNSFGRGGYSSYDYAPSYTYSNPAYDHYYPYYSPGPSSSSGSLDLARAEPDGPAHITLKVPADAEVWFDGARTKTTGAVRHYDSPPLTPGYDYTYQVRASWRENGHDVTETHQVSVSAGARTTVDFTSPAVPERKTSGTAAGRQGKTS